MRFHRPAPVRFSPCMTGSLLALAACARPGDPTIGLTSSASFANLGVEWPDPSHIPVCWEPASPGAVDRSTERAWVKDAIAATWTAANPHIRFTGWDTCAPGEGGVRVVADNFEDGPHVSVIGKAIDGRPSGMTLVFDLQGQADADPIFKSLSAGCFASEETRRTCIESVAIHEFGHALGLRHEQDRSTVPSTCDKDQGSSPGPGIDLGPYDPESIMNYCKENRLLANTLSALDVAGIRALYPADGSAPNGTADPGRPGIVAFSLGAAMGIVGGQEAILIVEFGDVADPAVLPNPATTPLTVVDGTSTQTLFASAWTPSGAGFYKGTARWTPAHGPQRDVEFLWNGTYAGTVTVGQSANWNFGG